MKVTKIGDLLKHPSGPCENCGLHHAPGERVVVVGFKPGKAWRVEGAPALKLGDDGAEVVLPDGAGPKLVDTMVPDARRTCAF